MSDELPPRKAGLPQGADGRRHQDDARGPADHPGRSRLRKVSRAMTILLLSLVAGVVLLGESIMKIVGWFRN
jgi:hypothetical protein